jgi:hypothetical protein
MQHNKTDITICIPKVDTNITKQEIFDKIRALRVGFIEKIIEIPLKNDEMSKRVIVKFKTWVENDLSNKILCRFEENKDIKIVYNDPWYWVAYQMKQKTQVIDISDTLVPKVL